LVDLNGDGLTDLLSGSYSRMTQDMAGLFQVLWGEKGGTFRAAEVLNGSDGEPLLLPAGGGEGAADVDRICTRAFVADLDGDGKLDLVSGNFSGTFLLFAGEAGGKFAPKAKLLEGGGQPLRVDAHSDPFLVDWDGDGDLDLLSGSAHGGAFLFPNVGTKQAPKWGGRETLVEAAGYPTGMQFGDAHVKGPGASTRLWADDVDGDGKLDLLIGDSVTLRYPAEGVDDATAAKQLADFEKEQQRVYSGLGSGSDQETGQRTIKELEEKKAKIVREEMTGFVWLLRRKQQPSGRQ
jgi:hypothetical protein